MQEYILKPIMTPQTVVPPPASDKPAMVKFIPPRQPLPTAVIDPGNGKSCPSNNPRCIEPVRIERDLFERQWWGE